jgi:hypothetical protein
VLVKLGMEQVDAMKRIYITNVLAALRRRGQRER